MTKTQANAIIGLLIAFIVVIIGGFAYLVASTGSDSEPAATDESAVVEDEADVADEDEADEGEEMDSAAVLEEAGVDVVRAAPVPEAVERFGDYELARSWSGETRVFQDSDFSDATAEDGSSFPATMNRCGSSMYFVTFRATTEGAVLDARLRDAADGYPAGEQLADGWMLGTNCVTPTWQLLEVPEPATMADVAYTVHEYRQSSVANANAPAAAPPIDPPPEPAPAPEPYLVECLSALSSTGIYSDGQYRETPECLDERAVRAEGVCGGLYGWRDVTREEYLDLCGREPPG